MRLRNVKNKQKILESCEILINNPTNNIGQWNMIFGNNNPIEIELGMGKGQFIINKALLNPNVNFIGIEKYDSVLARAIEKIPQNIKNLKLIRMDVIDIDKVFNKEIDRIYLNFSDPWPKKRHSSRRLTSSMFLEKYEQLFFNKKVIYQKTDNRNLFEFSIVNLSSNGYLIKEVSLDLHNSDIKNEAITEYEEKFSLQGNPIYYLKAEK